MSNNPESYIAEYTKDPADVLDYSVDWSSVVGFNLGVGLDDSDEVIATSAWSVRSNDGSLVLGAELLTATLATVVVSGGNVATDFYDITNHITTSGGAVVRQYSRTIRLRIRNR